MRAYRNLPLRHKLTLVIVLTTALALLAALMAAVTFEWIRQREMLVGDLEAQAQIIGANSAAALAFGDVKAGRETLSALRVRRQIERGILLTQDGKVFTTYEQPGTVKESLPRSQLGDSQWFEGGHLHLTRRIFLGPDVVGGIYLCATLRPQRVRLISYAVIAGVVWIALLLAAWVLAGKLQRIIVEPVVALARVARDVREHQDYSLRAEVRSTDEVGGLAGDFNRMLEQIQQSNDELRESEERFRQLANNIQQVFWLQEAATGQIIYVSPAFQTIWGRSVAMLYVEVELWIETVYFEDRERIRQLLARQWDTPCDEAFRIVRLDKSVRWIRARVFPIRDLDEKVYRLAGIAEDITDQKKLEREVLEISDREKARLGQDLHDGLSQHLISTAFAANLLAQKLGSRAATEFAEAQQVTDLLDQAITEARALARGLYPVKLEAEGLSSALDELAVATSSRFALVCKYLCPQPVFLSDTAVATHLYRIAQEATNNAVKHSHATQLAILLIEQDGRLTLSVTDNGTGLPPTGQKREGMGLHIMRYRVGLIGGILDVQSRPQHGTTITCSVQRDHHP